LRREEGRNKKIGSAAFHGGAGLAFTRLLIECAKSAAMEGGATVIVQIFNSIQEYRT
jgi:hypothetical protein